MKKTLALLLVMTASTDAFANIDGYYAIIQDTDGYVNVRSKDSLQSSILTKLPNGTPVSANCSDYSPNQNFCFARFGKSESGFVYKNRLQFLAPNTNYNKLALTHMTTDATSATYSNRHLSATIKFHPTLLDLTKAMPATENALGCYAFYQGDCLWGVDEYNDSHYYQLQSIQVILGGKTINIPASAIKNILLNQDFLNRDLFTQNFAIYQNKANQDVYIIGALADGALSYSVIYEIKHGKYYRSSVWYEAS